MSINKVFLAGNITRDPELRSTTSGNPVLTWGLAVNSRRQNKQTGEWEDYPNFVDCVMYGHRAEAIQRYLAKGTKVSLEGELCYRAWEKDGQKRSKLEVIVRELEFMGPRAAGGDNAAQQQAQTEGGDLYAEDVAF